MEKDGTSFSKVAGRHPAFEMDFFQGISLHFKSISFLHIWIMQRWIAELSHYALTRVRVLHSRQTQAVNLTWVRRRPGHLLNVLYTFDLPPVLPGMKRDVLVFVKYLYFYLYLQTVQLKKNSYISLKRKLLKTFLHLSETQTF